MAYAEKTVIDPRAGYVGENINALQSTQDNERSRTPAFDRQKSLIVELRDAAEEVSSLERQLAAIDLEIEDSSIFIRNLEANLIALEQSNVAIDSLGQIQFEFCPACFAEIVHPSSDVCSLCKTPTSTQRHSSNIHKMRQEISYQLRESNELQNARVRHREELSNELEKMYFKKEKLGREYLSESQSLASEHEAELQTLYKQLGYLDRQLDDLEDKRELIGRIEKLREQRSNLEKEKSELKESIERRKSTQEQRRAEAYLMISELCLEKLKSDLAREERFQKADRSILASQRIRFT